VYNINRDFNFVKKNNNKNLKKIPFSLHFFLYPQFYVFLRCRTTTKKMQTSYWTERKKYDVSSWYS